MSIEELLNKIKAEYQDSVSKCNEAKAKLQELQEIKQAGNYEEEIANLEFKQKILTNPKKAIKDNIFNFDNIFTFILFFSLAAGFGSFSFLILDAFSKYAFLESIVITLFLTIGINLPFFKSLQKKYEIINSIIARENLSDIIEKLNELKTEKKELEEDILYYQNKVEELKKITNMHYNTYRNISEIDHLVNPLVPFVEEENRSKGRVLSHEQ